MIFTKPLTISDKKALEEFYHKAYPEKNDIADYLQRTIFAFSEENLKKSLLIYDNDSIIGVNLCIPGKSLIGLKEYDILWSYDTLVLDEYRQSDAGTFIGAFWYKNKNNFGAGLSGISEKMNKIMKSKFIAYSPAFLKINYFNKYILNLIHPIFPLNHFSNKIFPKIVKVQGGIFELIEKPEELILSETGYWNHDIIEFKRDREFINWRFFYPGSPYVVYSLKNKETETPVYFAARICIWRNIPLIYLVDYRFKLSSPNWFKIILNCAEAIRNQLGCAGVYTRTSLDLLTPMLKDSGYMRKGQGAQIVTRFKPATQQKYPVFFTPADSDMDFKIEYI